MIKIPNYTTESELGQGGMAKVYLAKQDMLHRYVALKVMFQDLAGDKNFRKSFLSEGSTIANLEHTNIVRIHDIGITDDSVFYMAMEYLSGGSLKDKLEQGKLSYSSVVNILQEVASGLAYAHKKGYIHRDIKPGNILFREDGVAVLTDFGIAKLQDTTGELTRMGYTMGTVQYMSPEQAITTDLDQRSDIYSLGLVFYEMLTGAKAFLAESTIQAIHQHTTVPPPSLPEEYAFLQPVLDKVLAKDPEDRYQTVNDFLRAVQDSDQADKTVIRRINREEDLEATRVYATNNIKPEAKKKKSTVAMVLGLMVFLAVGGFGVSKYLGLLEDSGNINVEEKSTITHKPDKAHDDQEALEKRKSREIEEARQKEIALQKEETKKAAMEKEMKQKMVEEKRKKEEAAKLQELTKLRAAEEQKVEEEKLAKRQAEDERIKKEELAKQQAEEEKIKKEELANQQANDAEKEKQKALAKQKLDEEKAKKKKEEELARKKAKKKALAKKKAKEKAKKKKNLAKEKARIAANKKAAEKKRKSAKSLAAKKAAATRALAKKKADAARRQQQFGSNQVQVSVTLNGKPHKATLRVFKNGKQVKLVRNQSFAKIQLPSGRYTVSTQYGGKSSSQVVNLGGNEVAQLRFAFRGQAPAPANSKWTHTHQPAPQRKPPVKPRSQPKPPPKKESKADRMVKEVEELWFDR